MLTTLPAAALARLRTLFASEDPIVRFLVRVGLVLLASGLFHVAVWLAAGAPSLEGPVSWRKPIVFGISSGVTTLSVAWLASLLGPTLARTRAAWTYALAMCLEISLIDLQRWRGVASHFNAATPLDSAIYAVMGVVILTSVGGLVALGWQLWRAQNVAQDTRLAGALGVAFVLLGSLMGIAISVHASIVTIAGTGTPSFVGAAPMKIPHGIALHALQLLPMLAWVLGLAGVTVSDRARLVVRAAMGHGVLFAAALVQLFSGRAPTDPAPIAIAIGLAGLALMVSPLVRIASAPALPRRAESL